MAFALLNRLITKPGMRDQVVGTLLESGRLFDGNEACLLYLVTETAEDPNVVWVVDLWTTEAAHEEALKTPELRPYVAETLPLLEEPPEQIELHVRGGRGVSD